MQQFAPRGVGLLEPEPVTQPMPRDDPDAMERTLALCERLLAAVETFALQLELPDLGAIDLPPEAASQADQANLRTAAALYLAAELEEARLLAAVETFAGVFASGGLSADLGPAEPLLVEFWRGRKERFTEKERRAIFARLFGTTGGPTLAARDASNAEFENLMLDLTEAISRLHGDPFQASSPATDIQIRASAHRLAENLAIRGGGITAYAARDLLEAIKAAIRILRHPEAQQAAGARSLWAAVRNIAGQYLDKEVETGAHVARGKAGLQLLAWLAESLPHLSNETGQLVAADHPVVNAALGWLQASLNLLEEQK